ncbi:MAG TPA: helix-turn-helix domain-containing protein [Solirubrobacterales bacterium]|nr:helix-turn-helix domain-containing protein [Solirubrobacterales bacterium]
MIMHAKYRLAEVAAEGIGSAVRAQRERTGLRQDELAFAAGVSTRVVHQIEHGKATSRLDSIVAVLDALGMTLDVVQGRGNKGGSEA